MSVFLWFCNPGHNCDPILVVFCFITNNSEILIIKNSRNSCLVSCDNAYRNEYLCQGIDFLHYYDIRWRLGMPLRYSCSDPLKKYIAPVLCPVGYVCPRGLLNKTSLSRPCYNGELCPTTGVCTPLPCQAASYCPPGSSQALPCQPDFYCPTNSKKQVRLTSICKRGL